MKNKKGFTLIEIMIVLTIIAILTPIVIPKLKIVKVEAVNKKVDANVFMVKAFLEDRRFLDKVTIYDQYDRKSESERTDTLLSNTLNTVKQNVGQAMESVFTASRAIENPFTESKVISYNISDITLFNSDCSAIIIRDTTITPPEKEDRLIYPSITDWKKYAGKIIVTVFKDRYSGYGVGRDGSKISPFIVKMPENRDLSVGDLPSVLTPEKELERNVSTIVDYLEERISDSLPSGSGDDKEKFFMQRLWNSGNDEVNSFKNEFGRNGNPIENPYSHMKGVFYENDNQGATGDNDLDQDESNTDAKSSIIVFEKSQFIEKNDTTVRTEIASLYKGCILISPINTTGQGNDVAGYRVRAIDGEGNVLYTVEIRR
jgi:prepilin-type N-terminal cleavage/methylation domain-containing protein